MKHLLQSTQLKQSEIRILVIDDHQIRHDQIMDLLQQQEFTVLGQLLDDAQTITKQLQLSWDLILFGQAYDLELTDFFAQVQQSINHETPILLLNLPQGDDHLLTELYYQGAYDLLDLNDLDRCYIKLVRALAFSQLTQSQHQLKHELQHIEQLKQEWLQEQNKAIALLEEGIHIDANSEYLNLFGLETLDEIIGVPLLDILQPKSLSLIKSQFKKFVQGNFDNNRLDIESDNILASIHNPLKIEFNPTDHPDQIEITILNHAPSNTFSTLPTEPVSRPQHPLQLVVNKMQQFLQEHAAQKNALVIFSLASCPDFILESNWDTFKGYFAQLSDFIIDQTNGVAFKLETALYATIIQAENIEVLKSRLSALLALEKPRLVTVAGKTYQQHVKLGYSLFHPDDLNLEKLEQLMASAYNTRLPQIITDAPLLKQLVNEPKELDINAGLHFKLPIEPEPTEADATAQNLSSTPQADQALTATQNSEPNNDHANILIHLTQVLEKDQISLKYQQIYDKQDTNLNTYEVTSGFIYENQWIQLAEIEELEQDPELSMRLDHWILIEAAKQLHNFLTQYPEAKLIVTLSHHVLLQPQLLTELVGKLLSIVGSQAKNPLILQLKESAILPYLAQLNPLIEDLRAQGADLAVADFGITQESEKLLRETAVNKFSLHDSLSKMLEDEAEADILQQRLQHYHGIKPIQFLLKNLNDMNSFANAWNVDARFLQGDYFQKKLDHLTNV